MKTRNLVLLTLIIIFPFSGMGQDKQDTSKKRKKKVVLSGFVTDSLMNPVPGAAIFIDGKKTGTFTDHMGFYSLKIKIVKEIDLLNYYNFLRSRFFLSRRQRNQTTITATRVAGRINPSKMLFKEIFTLIWLMVELISSYWEVPLR